MVVSGLLVIRLSESFLLPFSLSDYPIRLKGFSKDLQDAIGTNVNLAPLNEAIDELQKNIARIDAKTVDVLTRNLTALNATATECMNIICLHNHASSADLNAQLYLLPLCISVLAHFC